MVTYQATEVIVAAPPQQAPGAASASVSVIVVLVLGFLLHRAIEKKQAKWPHVLMSFAIGVLLAGSLFGSMVEQITGSVGTALVQMFTTVAGSGAS